MKTQHWSLGQQLETVTCSFFFPYKICHHNSFNTNKLMRRSSTQHQHSNSTLNHETRISWTMESSGLVALRLSSYGYSVQANSLRGIRHIPYSNYRYNGIHKRISSRHLHLMGPFHNWVSKTEQKQICGWIKNISSTEISMSLYFSVDNFKTYLTVKWTSPCQIVSL